MFAYSEMSLRAASYSRLSREDEDKDESESVRNQKELISDYAARRGIPIFAEYVDDGYGGTDFERPDFQRMMDDVKKKRINCIIVKDLSRLGRNYIETGRYIEKIFPVLGVRFIAINDHYDSAEEGGDADRIVIPFKNLINDAYCRDISVKIRSQLDVKRKNGKFIGNFAPYGYRKDPMDKNRLIVDEPAAAVVREIFFMKMRGFSVRRICERLDSMDIATPLAYKRACGLNYDSGFRSSRKTRWSVVTVNRILKNELYIGTMVQGKRRKINYKVKQSRWVEQKDWVCVADTHAPIVSDVVFDAVQRLMAMDTRTSPSAACVYPLSGFLCCGDCGQSMVRRTVLKNGKAYAYYHCSGYKRGEGCSSHNISEEKLVREVHKLILCRINAVLEAERILTEERSYSEKSVRLQYIDRCLNSLDCDAERYVVLQRKVSLDRRDGTVSEKEYAELQSVFSAKIEEIETDRKLFVKRRETLLGNRGKGPSLREMLQKYRNANSLDRDMIASLVERIFVYDGSRIEVKFLLDGEMNALLEAACRSRCKTSGGRRSVQ